jgi:hypothetical protein
MMSLNLGNAFTWQTSSFNEMPLKKEVDPNEMPKTLMSFNGQQNPIGGKKSKGKLEGDQVEHLQGCITSPIKIN